jgi:hypothetical protein
MIQYGLRPSHINQSLEAKELEYEQLGLVFQHVIEKENKR